ncbi:MAG: HAMP domain-containing sensor histidine kinase [Gallicola sp.]|nr:HAMP domain-containing sensor histidine kinase [Gallicola sp.]
MIKTRYLILINLMLSFIVFVIFFFFLGFKPDEKLDLVEINQIAHLASDHYGFLEASVFPENDMDFVVLDKKDTVLFQKGWEDYENLYSALGERATVIDLPNRDDRAKVVFQNTVQDDFEKAQFQMSIAVGLALLSIFTVNLFYLLYINIRIIKPFEEMKGFASSVARGNFEVPLKMDRGNLFGAFTESFDIMRTEIKTARDREREAVISKQELVASLSHDIKTPLASIEAVSELALVQNKEEKLQKQFTIIRNKAEQIDRLVTDLFNTTLEDLDKLPVQVVNLESSKLPDLIREADYNNLCRISSIPDCIVKADPLRLQQVFDNIIANSYKYAGTEIEVQGAVFEQELQIVFSDKGPGVSESDLPLLKGKFYRGENSLKLQGSGLGLYISNYFVQQMEGRLSCDNTTTGFAVTITLQLA